MQLCLVILFSWGAINVSSAKGKYEGSTVGSQKSSVLVYLLEGTHPLTPTFTGHNGIFVFLLLSNSLALDTESPGLLYITH